MDGSPNAGAREEGALVVERERADLSRACSPPHLLQLLPAKRVEDPNDGSSLRGRG